MSVFVRVFKGIIEAAGEGGKHVEERVEMGRYSESECMCSTTEYAHTYTRAPPTNHSFNSTIHRPVSSVLVTH